MSIVTRAEWGARPPSGPIYLTQASQRQAFVVHHSATSTGVTPRSIQTYQMDGNGWPDIGYNGLTDFKGVNYEGRQGGLLAIGAHVKNHNTATIGWCYIGDGRAPTDEAKFGLRQAYDQICRLFGRRLEKRYHSHYSPTECPGDDLREWVLAGMPYPEGTGGYGMDYTETQMRAFPWQYNGRGIADNDLTAEDNKSTLWVFDQIYRQTTDLQAHVAVIQGKIDETGNNVARIGDTLLNLEAIEGRLTAAMAELTEALRRVADALAGESGGQ